MSFLDRLFGRGGAGGAPADQHGIFYYIRCRKCGESLRIRLDQRWDLQQEFEGSGDDVTGYRATKEVMGKQCFNMMKLEVSFDSRRREVQKELRGGDFITRDDYESAPRPTGPSQSA